MTYGGMMEWEFKKAVAAAKRLPRPDQSGNQYKSCSQKDKGKLPPNIYHASSKDNPYQALAWKNGKRHYVGGFETVEKAQAAIDKFKAGNS